MDIGTFSTNKVDPYEVDGTFLAGLRQRMIGMVEAVVAPDTLHTETIVGARANEHAVIQRKDPTGAILLDGLAPHPDSLEITAGGVVHGPDGLESFYVSLGLRVEGGDFLYAKGPAREAAAAFEAMRGAMASRAMPAQIAAQVKAKGSDPLERAWSVARWVLGAVGVTVYLCGIVLHPPYGFAMMVGGLLTGLLALSSPVRILRGRKDDEAEPKPKAPVSVIDLSRPHPEGAPAIDYVPTTPLDL